jgi:hypothetical protein
MRRDLLLSIIFKRPKMYTGQDTLTWPVIIAAIQSVAQLLVSAGICSLISGLHRVSPDSGEEILASRSR